MSIAQYCLSWDSHKNNVCNGFTNLQQNDEFVDMTLAADGHLVNVHKSIFALASPYIKTILQLVPNKYPVIFLNNISHEVLNNILTYVYTGEVSIEVDKIKSFMKAAKDLHLSGLSSMVTPKVDPGKRQRVSIPEQQTVSDNAMSNLVEEPVQVKENEPMLIDPVTTTQGAFTNSLQLNTVHEVEQIVDNEPNAESSNNNPYVGPTIDQPLQNEEVPNNVHNSNSGLYTTADGYQYRLELANPYLSDYSINVIEDVRCNIPNLPQIPNSGVSNSTVNKHDNLNSVVIENNAMKNEIPINTNKNGLGEASSNTTSTLDPKALTPQYTMSSRGALQLILNRYMYYSHHQSRGGRKRRWRCIDYRRKHCPAFIDTDCDIMTTRKFVHSHSFHDEKIIKKMSRDMVFTNLNKAIQKLSRK